MRLNLKGHAFHPSRQFEQFAVIVANLRTAIIAKLR